VAELWRRGALPVLVDQDGPGLDRQRHTLASDGLQSPLAVTCDVTSLPACEAAVQSVLSHHGRIDVVWANAGMASFGPLAYIEPAAWRRCIEVNVVGSFHTVRAALPAVRAQRGYVCLTASVSTFAHPPMMSAYAASKSALEAMANAWRIELAAHGVDVGVIHASWVSTPLVGDGELHPGFVRLRDTVPRVMRRMLTPQDAARRMVDGIEQRRARIWLPSWVRMLFALRSLLHTPPAERALRRAAPDLEALYLDVMATQGAMASSYPPRELQRALERGEIPASFKPDQALGVDPSAPTAAARRPS
jgi:NAD(P)-dependent dehydrogenase (short-subunit alcohol dehydrogenase family)